MVHIEVENLLIALAVMNRPKSSGSSERFDHRLKVCISMAHQGLSQVFDTVANMLRIDHCVFILCMLIRSCNRCNCVVVTFAYAVQEPKSVQKPNSPGQDELTRQCN